MNKEKLRVVLDTNIILASAPEWSRYRLVMDRLIENYFETYLTTEILLEYEEKLREFYDKEIADLIIQVFTLLPNAINQSIYYNMSMIVQDADDNKFADCAFASNAHYLVSNDKHFNVLKKMPFPKIKVINMAEFISILQNMVDDFTPAH
jgi:uncharacterized protein